MRLSHIISSFALLSITIIFSLFAVTSAHAAWGLDPAFGTGGKVVQSFGSNAYLFKFAYQPDGKIVVGGFVDSGSHNNWALARYNTDGTLDSTFGTNGIVTQDFGVANQIHSVKVQADGKIVAAGTNGDNLLWTVGRYNADGTLDTTFGGTGLVSTIVPLNGGTLVEQDITLQADGKIVTAGYNGGNTLNGSDFTIVRYNTDGSLDNAFGTNGIARVRFDGSINDNAHAVAMQQDGKILEFGDFAFGGPNQPLLVRYNSDGTLDTTFGAGGFVLESLGFFSGGGAVMQQPDGKILVAGGDFAVSFPNPPLVSYLIRYNSDGSRDATFGVNGLVLDPFQTGNDGLSSIALQTDGKIVVSGSQLNNFSVSRLNPDGSLDNTFGTNGSQVVSFGVSSDAAHVEVSPLGKILGVGGNCATFCDWVLAQFSDVAPTPTVTSTPTPATPTNKDQCKNDGWKIFTNPVFKNQGDCVSFVEHL